MNGIVISADDPASSVFINNCTFRSSYSIDDGYPTGVGGAVYARGSLHIENSTFEGNYLYLQPQDESWSDGSSPPWGNESSSSFLATEYPDCPGPLYWINDSICDTGKHRACVLGSSSSVDSNI